MVPTQRAWRKFNIHLLRCVHVLWDSAHSRSTRNDWSSFHPPFVFQPVAIKTSKKYLQLLGLITFKTCIGCSFSHSGPPLGSLPKCLSWTCPRRTIAAPRSEALHQSFSPRTCSVRPYPYLPYPLYVPNIHPLQDWHAKGLPVFDVTTPLRTKITKVFLEDFLLKARHVACGAIHVHSDSSLASESCARNSASGEPMHSGQVCRSKPTKHSCWSCSCCLRAAAAPSRAFRVSEKKCWFCQICQTS